MWKRFLGIMAAALCVLNLTVGSAFSADLVKVPTAWLDEHETFLMWYAKEKGWDKEAGLDIEMKLFNSGPDILNALPAGEWRFAAVGALPAMLGNLRYGTSIIAQANNEAALCTSVVVRADSPIAKVKGWNKDYPEVYGSPETVRGKTFLATTLRMLSPKQEILLQKLKTALDGEELQVMNSILAQFALYWEYR